jgi:hypothetical protein
MDNERQRTERKKTVSVTLLEVACCSRPCHARDSAHSEGVRCGVMQSHSTGVATTNASTEQQQQWSARVERVRNYLERRARGDSCELGHAGTVT